ncbi:SRPBCC family protein [Mesorhizobium sp. PAMC28654]|uniref:SRPBCC family protein n=1 Tax=Mesorhizobium sp. PAMC28654 TaxID=2880934 RepID=UPI001D0B4747|nr:SRPBCC family protein [Mesorhizobium sp. PAMC28654]UDL88143.1 SRPBCC family protein [Mesorhizobium sp. PAMC28654]
MNQIAPVKDEHSVIHSTFTIERTYPQSPERVFFAFADKSMVRQWRIEGDGFAIAEFSFDFRVGGSEVSRFSYAGGPEIRLDAQFQDIVPGQRIVFSYRMAIGPQPLSASLTTVELTPSGEGTRLTYTEQGAFFDGADSVQGREEGTRGLLEALAAHLQKSK